VRVADADPGEFSEPEPNLITSSNGFAIKVLGRTGMRYVEGPRSVWIDSEVMATPRTMAMYEPSIRTWESPEDPGPVTDQDRVRIVENIRRAFAACGYELQVIGPLDWSTVAVRPPTQSEPIPGSDDLLVFGRARSNEPRPPLRRVRPDGLVRWEVFPPDSQDSWVSAEVDGQRVVARSWSCWRVVIDTESGQEIERAFTK
jgi:hypothetical protein